MSISRKTNRVLNLISVGLLLILVRVWYLGVIQHEHHLELARKPQRRVKIEPVERATIRDRFNIPLAINKLQYNAALSYAPIRDIPSVVWKKDEKGKWVRKTARMDYISLLAKRLAQELGVDPVSIEDTIHGKACLFPHTPFVIKENISEEEYYRLRMLEKEWAGIAAQRVSKRHYPLEKAGADIIGYVGAISSKEYLSIAQEIATLQEYLQKRDEGEATPLPKGYQTPLEVRGRLKELQEKSYTINDLVGKSGVESAFDQKLRGSYGKQWAEVDVKGNFLRELPGGREPKSGERLLLTISAELQLFAEKLLAHQEPSRNRADVPWIKGGAIVALDPKTGEVLALASYPRIDPNDFVPAQDPRLKKRKSAQVSRWLENESYAGEIWDGKRPLEKEKISPNLETFSEERLFLTWENYLQMSLTPNGSVHQALEKIGTIGAAVRFQEAANINDSYLSSIPHTEDKLLVIDLCRMVVQAEKFSEALLAQVGNQSFSTYRAFCQAALSIQSLLRPHMQELFHDLDFQLWRQSHFKEFLKQKRKEEKEKKRYTRPYTDYLDLIERGQFKEFWKKYRWAFVYAYLLGKSPLLDQPELRPYFAHLQTLQKASAEIPVAWEQLKELLLTLHSPIDYLQTIRSFEELDRPLLGKYATLRNFKEVQLEKHLAAAFYPVAGFSYGRSRAYQQSAPQGSVFKLVTAYEGLRQRYLSLLESHKSLRELNPLTLIDDLKGEHKNSAKQILGSTLEGQPITRIYKGGQLPRSSHSNMGRLDIVGAIEQSSNIYFSILAAEHLKKPEELPQAARLFGFGQKSGIGLPGETGGNVPDDVAYNRTALYSLAIGQHALVVSPLQTALMVTSIANGGTLFSPKIVKVAVGKEVAPYEEFLFDENAFPLKEELGLIGISFPLFTEAQGEELNTFVSTAPPQVRSTLFLPKEIRHTLLEGMHRVIAGPRGNARPQVIPALRQNPQLMRDYLSLQDQVVGKTGTAEILYRQGIDKEASAHLVTHTWFAGTSFAEEGKKWEEPELVVVVLLRFGERGGKEGAPLAIQMIKKWREIKSARRERT